MYLFATCVQTKSWHHHTVGMRNVFRLLVAGSINCCRLLISSLEIPTLNKVGMIVTMICNWNKTLNCRRMCLMLLPFCREWNVRQRERHTHPVRLELVNSICARKKSKKKKACLLILSPHFGFPSMKLKWRATVIEKTAKQKSDSCLMLHTLPISIQHAVNQPTVKHAGPANRCHTWRFWP